VTVRTAERPVACTAEQVVAFVGSAGGIRGFVHVLHALPDDFRAAVVVLLHLQAAHPSMLASILSRATGMAVKQAEAGDVLERSHVYVAPPDAHLLVRPGGRVVLDVTPPIHFLRPSADVLLQSLAGSYGADVMAIVFSGTGTDGAEGAMAIRDAGGVVLAQDERTSEYFGMPEAAINRGAVEQILALENIASAIAEFVRPSSS
jgi:two-component system, chemotaxis family, protein-glutamate methylesterase/glutaminase